MRMRAGTDGAGSAAAPASPLKAEGSATATRMQSLMGLLGEEMHCRVQVGRGTSAPSTTISRP